MEIETEETEEGDALCNYSIFGIETRSNVIRILIYSARAKDARKTLEKLKQNNISEIKTDQQTGKFGVSAPLFQKIKLLRRRTKQK